MRSFFSFSRSAIRVLLTAAATSLSLTALAQSPTDVPIASILTAPPSGHSDPSTDLQAIVPTLTPLPPSTPPAPPPFGGPLFERMKLTGDWSGKRSAFRDGGITFDGSTTQYYQGVVSGGRQDGFRYGGRGDYFLNVDGEKVGMWKGLFVTLHGETRYGQSANSLTGAMMPTNLLLAVPQPNGTVTALTGVQVNQFLSESMMVFGGRLNMFDGFKQQITGATGLNGFMNTAMMFNPVYARTIPYSTYGVGFAYLQDLQPVFSVAVIDTNNTPTTTGFNTFFNNGATLVGQLNVPTQFFELPGHQGVSGTYSSGKYSDLQPTAYFDPSLGLTIATSKSAGSWSLAYNFDQAFYASPDDPKKVWGVFGNWGLADGTTSPIRSFSNVGVSGTSPIQGRAQDTFGVGYYYLGVSDTLKELAPKLLPLRNEQGVELFYNIAVTPWFHITPDLQILDPFLKRADTAVVAGMRAKIDF